METWHGQCSFCNLQVNLGCAFCVSLSCPLGEDQQTALQMARRNHGWGWVLSGPDVTVVTCWIARGAPGLQVGQPPHPHLHLGRSGAPAP